VVLSLPYISAEGNASPEVLNNLNLKTTEAELRCIFFLKYNPFTIILVLLAINGALGLKTP
jgi:hypothetical protein